MPALCGCKRGLSSVGHSERIIENLYRTKDRYLTCVVMMQPVEFFNEEVETLDLETLEALQLKRLKDTLSRALQSPFYSANLGPLGLVPEDFESISGIQQLPFTVKGDLREDAYPYGFLTVPRNQLVRMHASSGTTGRPTVIFHTKEDLDAWAELLARCMYMVGVRPDDVFQNMIGYGLFTGGLGLHYGAERLGTLTIPSGPGNTKRQIRLMQDFSTTVIHVIPSYGLYLLQALLDQNLDPAGDLSLRIAFLGAEPHSEEVRMRIEQGFGIHAFNSYGLSEMNGPGVAFECPYKRGLHIWEDSYLAEIIDPATGQTVPEGSEGELVLTTLNRVGMPLIRYRTGDVTKFMPRDCPCGRVHRRMERISGRTDDMIILKGVNIFPMQVERVLMNIPEVGNNYQIVLETREDIDMMRVMVEVEPGSFVEDVGFLKGLQERVARELRGEILITPRVELVEPSHLPRAQGKAVRVVDNRKK
jgi:phenylacetate-CoA ligase